MSLAELRRLLRLRLEGPADAWKTRWTGEPQEIPGGRIFGGLLLAQSLVASSRTVASRQKIVSMQADFIGGVPTDRPLEWEVTRISDTPSLSTRRSSLFGERGQEMFSAVTRWATTREDLPSHGSARPAAAPSPEMLSDVADRFHADESIPLWWRIERPVHFRHAGPPAYQVAAKSDRTETTFFKATSELPDEPGLRAAVFAYATDMSILEPAFLALGVARHTEGARILSLTHSLTFHSDPDPSEWNQIDCRVDAIAHGRALGTGDVFDRGGQHVATVSQFGLVKVPASIRTSG
ncbi:acyl-CoA thioesterase [Amycolatopsis nivea]|uniref:acyl-CoA thioesterase n=1 Tax=Amycolatopsis nivea TaxID=1644109 RepID=UPI0014318BE2|nr:acyl-CoA thioesterase domain-containing protein [Amycolatopsis nivea]